MRRTGLASFSELYIALVAAAICGHGGAPAPEQRGNSLMASERCDLTLQSISELIITLVHLLPSRPGGSCLQHNAWVTASNQKFHVDRMISLGSKPVPVLHLLIS